MAFPGSSSHYHQQQLQLQAGQAGGGQQMLRTTVLRPGAAAAGAAGGLQQHATATRRNEVTYSFKLGGRAGAGGAGAYPLNTPEDVQGLVSTYSAHWSSAGGHLLAPPACLPALPGAPACRACHSPVLTRCRLPPSTHPSTHLQSRRSPA